MLPIGETWGPVARNSLTSQQRHPGTGGWGNAAGWPCVSTPARADTPRRGQGLAGAKAHSARYTEHEPTVYSPAAARDDPVMEPLADAPRRGQGLAGAKAHSAGCTEHEPTVYSPAAARDDPVMEPLAPRS